MKTFKLLAGAGTIALAAIAFAPAQPVAAQANRDIVVTGQIAFNERPEIAAGVGRAPMSWFRRVPSIIRPRLSPDGNKLVVQLQNQGVAAVGWIDLNSADRRPTMIANNGELRNAGDRVIGDYFWVGSDTIVLQVVAREIVNGQRGDFGRLVAYDLASGRMTLLAWSGAGGDASDVLHIDHEAGRIILQRQAFRTGRGNTERYSEVVDVDVRTGRFEMVQRGNPEVGGWFADPNGTVRIGVGYDRDSGRRRIVYRSSATDQFRTIFNEADPTFTDAGITPLWISPTSDNALVRDNKSGFSRLYRVNLQTMQYSEPVFASAGYDVDGIRLSFGGRLPVGFTVTEQRERTQWTNPVYTQIQQNLDEMFGAGNASIGSSNAAGTKFVIYVAPPNRAGSYYIYDVTSGALDAIGEQWSHLSMTEMNPVSAFRYRASDGVEMEAIMTWPRHRTQSTNLPMVMIVHGGPFGVRDDVRFDGWAQAIAELGYVVVQPNYRGSGGYGRQFVTMGRDNGFGLRMQDDLDDVITHLAREGTIDPNRVCMMGWSYGGYASARAAQRNPEKYRCTIAGAGVYDLPMMREYDSGYLGSFGANYLAKGAAELSTVSPARNTGGRWAPILIVHGVRDARVPIDQARTLVSRLRGSGKVEGTDFAYIEQPENTHNLNYDDVWVEWLEGAANWLERWNPAYIPSDSDRPVPVVPEGPRPQARRD
jgi:dipeptidyl aminopeptidase/acylaminoacyl peptidase